MAGQLTKLRGRVAKTNLKGLHRSRSCTNLRGSELTKYSKRRSHSVGAGHEIDAEEMQKNEALFALLFIAYSICDFLHFEIHMPYALDFMLIWLVYAVAYCVSIALLDV
ncbi:uncharacterized protein LOC119662100 [Teleopsis dalmanni]|uniref:uncharacterized protein LOC119662100 n=1 Tax=Teleopsis dalmanni TaxID=139649 RepID=UPI0018CF65B4|nr:uncharacterized protein LOC119662100 [Teleopsis dalmanni]XP_037927579.1 uncharacterized protein LOC119662100 [Teleopsis dalmanni]